MSIEKFIVLDVEGGSNLRPYNIGYVIADRYGNIHKKHSFVFPQFMWENISNAVQTGICIDMMKQNAKEMLNDYGNTKKNRQYKQISANEFYNLFTREIEQYNIKRLFAYNVTFDKNSLKRLFGEKFDTINIEYCDIIPAILQTKLLTRKYIQYCIDNNFLTEKGYISTKAETVYRYLTNNIDFIEAHTGLNDTLIEYNILLTVFKTHKKTDFKPCQAWRKIEKYRQEKGI